MSIRWLAAVVARPALAAAALSLAAGCTAIDAFEPRQPEVVLQSDVATDPITAATTGCAPGGTLFWGTARNVGDVDVVDVSIVLTVFDGAGASLGSFSGGVFNGGISGGEDVDEFSTGLVVGQSGTFNVCTPIPFGAAARVEARFRYLVIEPIQ